MKPASVLEGSEKLRSFVKSHAGPDWLQERRRGALALYEELPSPPPPSRDRNFPSLDPALLSFTAIGKENPIFESGSGPVKMLSLEEAASLDGDLLRAHLGMIAKPERNKWVALNQAVFNGGSFVRVPKNMDAGTVAIRHSLPAGNPLFTPRVFVYAEPGARLVLLDHYGTREDEEAFVAPVIEIVASENTDVYYVQIQEWGARTHHHSSTRITAERGARVTAVSCMLGGKRTTSSTEISLSGEGARAQILGLVLGNGDQVFEHYTLQEHLAPHTESDLLIKVALKDKAYSHFDGLIWIEKGAKKTGAYQQNRNLLLSKDAKAESIPRLEILDDDVRCTHGATVGPVDEEQLFYLATRGIVHDEAEALIVEGFFNQVLERVPSRDLREKLWQEVSKKLR